jgi:hypothetical protein
MKRRILIIVTVLLLPLGLMAQNLDDALRYSKLFYQGTARFNGMSGAFTALGGDLTSIALNPAGAAIFRSTEFSVSPQLTFENKSANFYGNISEQPNSNFNVGQVGLVSALTMGSGSGLTGLSVAYSYNRTNNFNQRTFISGNSQASSMSDYWASLAGGYYTDELEDNTTGGYMAYQTWMIDTLSGSYTQYASVFSYYGEMDPAYGQRTERSIDNGGFTGEHTIALGANVGDKLYLGAGVGITTLSYTGHYSHTEIDAENNVPDFVDFTYTDHFNATGSGWNFKFGAILKPIEMLRLGLSFTTPTLFRVRENYFSNLTSYFDGDTPLNTDDDGKYEVKMDMMSYAYRVTTPYRINTGVAVQIGTLALISADYEFVDYKTAKLSHGADGYNFQSENEELRSEVKSAANLRLGAEVRLGSVYFRGGLRHYGSTFRTGTLNEKADYSGYSAGIGYRQQGFFVDFSYSGLISSENYLMYPDAWLDPAAIETHDSFITATVGLKF